MAFRLAARSTRSFARTTGLTTRTAAFHTSRPAFIKVGDPLPPLADALHEGSPGNKVNLAEEAENSKVIILGVPAAFSPACSATHVPGFMQHPKTKDYDLVAVVSINDAFVMKAWGEALDPAGDSGFRFLADPSGRFTKELDMDWDGSAIFGNHRSKRYTITAENGKVTSVNVEPDNTGTTVSLAENVLGKA